MSTKTAWNRLAAVLTVLWCLFWLWLGFAGKDSDFPLMLAVSAVGAVVLFGLMKAIAWIASGLFHRSQE